MPLTDRSVLILAADLFEDMELLYPLYRLREEGVAVTVAGDRQGPGDREEGIRPARGGRHCRRSGRERIRCPGRFPAASHPTSSVATTRVLDLVRAFDAAGKPIAFICHAGWVPISAGILKGRRATSVGAIRDDMVNAGADWVDSETVVDGNLISARTPEDLGPWMRALISALEGAALERSRPSAGATERHRWAHSLEDLEFRGLVHQVTDPGLLGPARLRAAHRVHRVRPDRRQPARRQPASTLQCCAASN